MKHRHGAEGARAGRKAKACRLVLEALEPRLVMAELGLISAVARPDGRIVELVFEGPRSESMATPDWSEAFGAGKRLRTSAGTELEPLGSVVATTDEVLRWTSTFLVKDAARVITFGTEGLTVSAPVGLLDDGQGNYTGQIDARPLENRSLVDADGFTTQRFARGVGGVTLYVSSRYGNDNQTLAAATNPATPFASVGRAMQALDQGGYHKTGSAIRLLRGDVFRGNVRLTQGGQDRAHPFVIEDYWHDYGDGRTDPKVRPIMRSSWVAGEPNGFFSLNHFTPSEMNHVVIRRIRFEAVKRNGDHRSSKGLQAWKAGVGWAVDDCVFHNYVTGIDIYDPSGDRYQDFLVLRTVITDAHVSAKAAPWTHAQGLFAKGVDGLLISQCTFDRNGRTTNDLTGRDMYSHNMYIQQECGPATVWGNVIREGGSHGVQMRSGGILAYNYLGRNAIGGFVSYPGGAITHNVVEWADDIATDSKRGFGLAMNVEYGTSVSQVIEFNVIVNTVGGNPRAISTYRDSADGVRDGVVRNNTIYNAGFMFNSLSTNAEPPHKIRVRQNLVRSGPTVSFLIDQKSPEDWAWLESDQNIWHTSNADATFRYFGKGDMSLTGWQAYTGLDARSVRVQPRLVNNAASIVTYSASMKGPNTESGYVGFARKRRLDAWSVLLDTTKIFDYFAQQYRPLNVSGTGDGALDFYGAYDYRLPAPDLIALRDSGSSDSDNITKFTKSLSFDVKNTVAGTSVQLLRNGNVIETKTGGGVLRFTDPGPLSEGVHVYQARQIDVNGFTQTSASLRVTVDVTKPAPPPAPILSPDSDSGINNTDNVTSVRSPWFWVEATEAGARVDLMRRPADGSAGYVVVGSRVGTGWVVDPGPVSNGTYHYAARQVDVAGNVGGTGARLTVTVNSSDKSLGGFSLGGGGNQRSAGARRGQGGEGRALAWRRRQAARREWLRMVLERRRTNWLKHVVNSGSDTRMRV